MKVVLFSDTHGCHRQVDVPDGDLVLHAGDVCDRGNTDHVHDFLDWFAGLPHRHKVFIHGNHDFNLKTGECLIPEHLPSGVSRLCGSSCEIEGLSIWGANAAIKGNGGGWDPPANVDILMTHYPPFGVLDLNPIGKRCGRKELKSLVCTLKPMIHFFGDIHHSYGQQTIDGTHYVNGSLYKARAKRVVNEPVVLKVDPNSRAVLTT